MSYSVETYCHQGFVRDNMEDSAYPPCGFKGVWDVPFSVAVADGVGGLPGGEVASSVATRYVETIRSEEDFKREIVRAHLDIQSTFPGSATTLTLALFEEDTIKVFWIGDSSAVAIFDDGSYKLLTRPHVSMEGYITRVLGMGQPQFDKVCVPAKHVMSVLLFTDGLTAHFSIPEIVEMYKDGKDLIEEVLLAGAVDNVALAIVKPVSL